MAQRARAACGPSVVAETAPGRRKNAPDLTLDPVTGERPLWPHGPIAEIVIEGNRAVPTSLLGTAIESRVGAALEPEVVTADIRRLWQLEVLSDVQVRVEQKTAGPALIYRVVERPLIGAVTIVVDGKKLAAEQAHSYWRRIRLLTGGVYDPWRVRRAANRAQTRYANDGYMRASVTVAAPSARASSARAPSARAPSARIDLCFNAELGRQYELKGIVFKGNKGLADGLLLTQLETAEGKVNTRGGHYRPDWLTRDLARVQALYYEHGYLNVALGRPELKLDDRRGIARVAVEVREGRQFRYGTIAISGDPAAPPATYRALFAGRPGEVFVRSQVMAWIKELEARERAAGRVGPVVTPVTEVDDERALVDLRVDIGGE